MTAAIENHPLRQQRNSSDLGQQGIGKVVARFTYNPSHRRAIVNALLPNMDVDRAIERLESAADIFLFTKHVMEPKETKDAKLKWSKVSRLAEELLEAILDAEDINNPLLTRVEILRDFDFSPSEHQQKEAQELLAILGRLSTESRAEERGLALAIADRKGGRDRYREFFYCDVLHIWTELGGFLTPTSRTSTGGPLARFFNAAIVPVLGEALTVETMRDVVGRQRKRIKGEINWPVLPARPRGGLNKGKKI